MQRTCLCAHLLRTLTLKCKGAAEIHHRAGAIYASSSSSTSSGNLDKSSLTWAYLPSSQMQRLCPNQIIPTTCDDGRISLWPAMLRNLISGSTKCRWIVWKGKKQNEAVASQFEWRVRSMSNELIIPIEQKQQQKKQSTSLTKKDTIMVIIKCSFCKTKKEKESCDFLQRHLSSAADVTLARTTPWSDAFLEENNSASTLLRNAASTMRQQRRAGHD